MRETLATRFSDSVRPLTLNGVIDPINYKGGLKEIQTRSVASAIQNQADNKVLAEPAPPINKNETTLTRRTQTTLAQLRSGYSTKLNSYLNRIDPNLYPSDSCPDCEQSPHSTPHLFNCPANPTHLTTRTLWEDPPAAANFLGLPTNTEAEPDND